MKALIGAACAALCLTSTTSASAAEVGGRTSTVAYADLDLTHQEGVERLEQRVRAAVKAVCNTDDLTLRQQMRQRSCTRKSAAAAAGQVARALSRANARQAQADPTRTITIAR